MVIYWILILIQARQILVYSWFGRDLVHIIFGGYSTEICPKNSQFQEKITDGTLEIKCETDHTINIRCVFHGVSRDLNNWKIFKSCIEKDSWSKVKNKCHHKNECRIENVHDLGSTCTSTKTKILIHYTCDKLLANKTINEFQFECFDMGDSYDLICTILFLTSTFNTKINVNLNASIDGSKKSFNLQALENKNYSHNLPSVNNSAFDCILLLKNRIYSMAFFDSIELFAIENSRLKLHFIRLEFCNAEYLCNIDWLLRNNLTNFNILQTSKEFNVNNGLNRLNISQLGIENKILDINTIALLECFDLCPFGKINSSDPNQLDLMVIKTKNDSFKIVEFLPFSIFNINLKLNYKIFFSHYIIKNMSADNFSVEIQKQSLTNYNFNRTFFSRDLFRNETFRENFIIEFKINNDSFTSDNKSNFTNGKIENELPSGLDTTNLKNYFKTSNAFYEKTSDFPRTQEILGSNKTIFGKLESDHLIHVLENKNNLDGCLKDCSNHGNCVYDKFKDSYSCQCFPSFAGQACEINLDPCSSLQCLNSGTCISFKNRTFFCICSSISYGKRCEKLVDVCLNRTCSKNGICEPLNHKPKCKCFKSFYGNNCEHETREQIVVKRVRKASLFISIFVLISFFCIIFCLDLASFLGVNDGSYKKKQKKVTSNHRLVYVNKNSNGSET